MLSAHPICGKRQPWKAVLTFWDVTSQAKEVLHRN
jgi:hypothetical protein